MKATTVYLDMFECVRVLSLFGFTIAGFSCFDDENNMIRIAITADKYLPSKVVIGLKPIDNIQMAVVLAMKFSELNIRERQLYLECSLVGFGESRLLHTQALAQLINRDSTEERYKMDNIPATIVKHIQPLAGKYQWGYGISNLIMFNYMEELSEGRL